MDEITEYIVLGNFSLFNGGIYDLRGRVNKRIEEGWQPVGGINFMPNESLRFTQVMVKYRQSFLSKLKSKLGV